MAAIKLNTDSAKFHVRRKGELVSERSPLDSEWETLRQLVYPEADVFSGMDSLAVHPTYVKIFDSVGIHSNNLLAAGLYALMTSSIQQWFEMGPADRALLGDPAILAEAEQISGTMFEEINLAESNFLTAAHECYLSFSAFGNLTMWTEEHKSRLGVRMTAMPLANTLYVTGADGEVVGIYRDYTRTVSELIGKFGFEKLDDDTKKLAIDGKLEEKIPCTHLCVPLDMYLPGRPKLSGRWSHAAAFIINSSYHVLQEDRYFEQPFAAARFKKSEVRKYGAGAGATALANVKLLMRIWQSTIRGAQKAVDPPLLAPYRGFTGSIRTYPGGMTYYQKGRMNSAKDIMPFPSGNPGLGLDMIEFLHKRIKEDFYVDQLQFPDGPQRTAYEVLVMVEQSLRLLAPMFGRVQKEYLAPMLRRVAAILQRQGIIERPSELLKVQYCSPLAKAQQQMEANGLTRALAISEPVLKYDPAAAQAINAPVILREIFSMFSQNGAFIRSDDEINAARASQAKQQAISAETDALQKGGQGMAAMAQAAQDPAALNRASRMLQSIQGGAQ